MMFAKKLAGATLSLDLAVAGISGVSAMSNNLTPAAEAADGDTYNSIVQELVALNPGTTRSSMDSAIRLAAKAEGKNAKIVAQRALKESRAAEQQSQQLRYTERSSSGVKADKVLASATATGDVFFTAASTSGIAHGHSGIYYTKNSIVEAPGWRKVVRSINVQGVKVASGTSIQHVRTSQANRNKAAKRAYSYRGRGYNYNFAFNKTANGRMNCSQLVWAAYKTTTGIDLDANGGHGVYPIDILNSPWTSTYKRVW